MRWIKIFLAGFIVICLFEIAQSTGDETTQTILNDTIEQTSWPFKSRLTVNPIVKEMIDSISAERIMYNMENLSAFYTRHTNSDTLSSETGIGAARRWIYSQFQEYYEDSSASEFQPGYFTYEADICGIPGEYRNVMVTLPGFAAQERHFIVISHMDSRTVDVCNSTSYAPSANDNGSGTAVSMEIARVMSRYSFESTAIIMLVAGENQGLYGSTAYAQWAAEKDMQIDAVINNDAVGNIEGCEDPVCPPGELAIVDSVSVRQFSGGPETGSSCQLARYMKLKSMEYVEGFTIDLIPEQDFPDRSGDHIPFYNEGWPAVLLTEPNENGDRTGMNGRLYNENDTISTYNTNTGYMANIARINIAGIASLALAPETPDSPEPKDVGDGKSVFLTWQDDRTEPDFAGCRIAVRPQGLLFYSEIVDAGNVSEFILSGLTEGQIVYISISAYDIDQNESIFSEEVEFTPNSYPLAPENLETVSEKDGISLTWTPNNELDIEIYRLYRFRYGRSEPEAITVISHPAADWFDDTVSPYTLYTYVITAVDIDGFESEWSNFVYGQLVTHDAGIIVIDGTLDGGGESIHPTDQEVDDYYKEIVSAFTIGGYWDIADSNLAGIRLTDAHLALYSTVVLHCDVPDGQFQQDTTAIRKYLDNGGSLLLSGWNLSYAIAGVTSDFVAFPAGSFFKDYLMIDSLAVSQPSICDFVYASSLIPDIYPDLVIDSTKIQMDDNMLIKMDAFLGPLENEPLTEPLYIYESSLGKDSRLHGKPVGLRYYGLDFKVIIFDVPLYFIKKQQATAAVNQALMDLGETPVKLEIEKFFIMPKQFKLFSNYPNPFNLSTTISYNLPEPDNVKVAIYNLLGQEVEILKEGKQPAGTYSLIWNANDFPTGIYFCRLEGPNESQCIRMILLK